MVGEDGEEGVTVPRVLSKVYRLLTVFYNFKYGVKDHKTGDVKEHSEHRDGHKVTGHYELIDADGHKRTVHYTADKHKGFEAQVHREKLHHYVPEHHSHGHGHSGYEGGNVEFEEHSGHSDYSGHGHEDYHSHGHDHGHDHGQHGSSSHSFSIKQEHGHGHDHHAYEHDAGHDAGHEAGHDIGYQAGHEAGYEHTYAGHEHSYH
ncbi:histidine-rich glycoprotein-like [Drosophila innubila]|uniref:histidine-rich glycoprotein-like n=1 Tax=Drosophila innubila TaxID=198719 RepID=UPI00148CBF20|nr:histidine-rich glycoprotein-like [Drosophila innubila]